ncbi:hypothetical protein [Metabacillus fastidiosus]|uniref:hypothetical protein n=1 Tax=Metabacillus fastidiosus TaxID=1458 RepID=UPI003D2E61A1
MGLKDGDQYKSILSDNRIFTLNEESENMWYLSCDNDLKYGYQRTISQPEEPMRKDLEKFYMKIK